MPTIAEIKFLVKDIISLSNLLPLSIPQGTKGGKIWTVMKVDERDTPHETFNMWFNALFGEDCRDSGGRLHHITRGMFGIGCICSYLAKIDWSDHFPLDLVEIKLQRLITELRHIWCMAGSIYYFISRLTCLSSGSEADLTSKARPSRHIAPTSKLTDDNNAAQPQLAFQRKAVQDFRFRQAQEAESLPNPSSPNAAAAAASPIATPQLKRNLPTSADPDTEDDECDGGGVNEQPNPGTSLLVILTPPTEKLTRRSCYRQKAAHQSWHCKCFTDEADQY